MKSLTISSYAIALGTFGLMVFLVVGQTADVLSALDQFSDRDFSALTR
ncbi:MAG: hypothetical protein AAGB01_02700 [Cyanobacteria bacterium P01_F01_bin.42]